jgi:hypothetical protein
MLFSEEFWSVLAALCAWSLVKLAAEALGRIVADLM